MQFKNHLMICISLLFLFFHSVIAQAAPQADHQPRHFKKILVVIFENMSYAEIKNEPTFKRLVEYTGSSLSEKGNLIRLKQRGPRQDSLGNGYAFFSRYYNNQSGGKAPTRPSQPNYIAMTAGSIHGIKDNENHDIDVDNLALELIDAGIKWKVYAENLPDPKARASYHSKSAIPAVFYSQATPYVVNPALSEQENDEAQHKYYSEEYKKAQYPYRFSHLSSCFTGDFYPSKDGYARKHQPFISYKNVQSNFEHCKNIVNSTHLYEDINDLPPVSFYIPNQVNNGHNGNFSQRTRRANAFLSRMMGTDPKTGEPLANASDAPFQKLMAQGGLLVITFDESSISDHPDRTLYTLFAGKMVNSGLYPDQSGKNAPVCYPPLNEQTKYPRDANGDYDSQECNHYNLLKMIESNWNLRSLHPEHTSAGYKYAFALDESLSDLWKSEIRY